MRWTSRSKKKTSEAPGLKKSYDQILRLLEEETRKYYRARLVSFVIFGSVGRETYRSDSDIDILLIVKNLPVGRRKRITEFMAIEKRLGRELDELKKREINIELSPILKTPEEALGGSPLFLDMVEDAKVVYDRGKFFESIMTNLKARLKALGAKRCWKGNAWYWDLKPDYRPKDVFHI